MHVKTKRITFLGLLLALNIILQFLGSYMEASTLSFLVLSSLCLAIAIYETNLTLGSGFLIASVALSFFLMPDKFYCLSYGCLCIYIFFQEVLRQKTRLFQHTVLLWIVKLLFFNGCFLFPALYFFPELLFSTAVEWSSFVYIAIIAAAQLFLLLFDRIYNLLIPRYWERLKKRLRIHI